MWQWIRGWLVRLGILSPPKLTAASVMDELRAGRRVPANASEWQTGVARFKTKVFAEADRKRLWRRYRRKFAGELRTWDEIVEPNDEDQACLNQILQDLAR